MNPGNQLVIGIILIATGLALAILGYVIFTNREQRDEDLDAGEGPSDGVETPEEEETGEMSTEESDSDDDVSLPPWVVPHEEDEEEPAADEPIDDVPPESEPPESTESEVVVPPVDSIVSDGEAAQRSIDIATIARDEVSGELIIRVGEKTFHSPASLRNAPEWTRVQYAAQDLMAWISSTETEQEKADREQETAAKPKSMIQQINDILQEEIEGSGVVHRGIRLMETADGAVKVLLGVQSYALDEVPDEAVQALIRKAVSIWEDQQ